MQNHSSSLQSSRCEVSALQLQGSGRRPNRRATVRVSCCSLVLPCHPSKSGRQKIKLRRTVLDLKGLMLFALHLLLLQSVLFLFWSRPHRLFHPCKFGRASCVWCHWVTAGQLECRVSQNGFYLVRLAPIRCEIWMKFLTSYFKPNAEINQTIEVEEVFCM